MNSVFLIQLVLASVVSASKEILTRNGQRSENDELVSVAVLYRHGDRTPIGSYPNDPYWDIRYWPEGFGQLVNQGKLHQFNLGKWLRKRYDGFISRKYSNDDIFVRSSDVDRTLMSAAANLAGLFYPPDPSDNWREGLPWEPIPIHTVPQDDDDIIAMSKQCDKFEKLYTGLCDSEFFKNISKEHKGIFDIVNSKTGWNTSDISSFQGLYTVFYVYRQLNTSFLPEWAYQLDENEFSYLAGLSFSRETFTKELQRLKVGPFMNYLNNHFDNVITGNTQKFLMLSGHDGTIAGILNTFGAYDYHPPEFCSTIIWELRKNLSGDHYLNIFYKKNSTETLKEVVVEGCTFDCEFGDYKNILQPIIVDSVEWQEECKFSN